MRLFCARAFFPLPFSQAKPSPRTAAPNVQARGRFKSEKGEDETKKKEDKEKEIKCSRKTAQEPLTCDRLPPHHPLRERERERKTPTPITLAHALPPLRRGHMFPRGFGHEAPCICPLRRQVVFLVHHLDVAVTLAPTEVRFEFLKTSFFVVAVFSVSMVQ